MLKPPWCGDAHGGGHGSFTLASFPLLDPKHRHGPWKLAPPLSLHPFSPSPHPSLIRPHYTAGRRTGQGTETSFHHGVMPCIDYCMRATGRGGKGRKGPLMRGTLEAMTWSSIQKGFKWASDTCGRRVQGACYLSSASSPLEVVISPGGVASNIKRKIGPGSVLED